MLRECLEESNPILSQFYDVQVAPCTLQHKQQLVIYHASVL